MGNLPPGTEDRTRLGERLYALRKQRGLSREVVAVRAGLGSATVKRIEAGERDPRLGTIEAIAEVLGTTAAELLGDAPDPAPEAA